MKKPITMMTTLLFLILILWGINSCKRNENEITPASPTTVAATTAPPLNKTAGPCYCDKTYVDTDCKDCVTGPEGIMKGANYIEYNIKWKQCFTDDPNYSGCFTPSTKTKISFCYGDPTLRSSDCDIYMQVYDPPMCLQCLNPTMNCQHLKATCSQSGNSMNVILSGNTEEITYSYEITVVGDPNIRFTCTVKAPNGTDYTYTCEGEF